MPPPPHFFFPWLLRYMHSKEKFNLANLYFWVHRNHQGEHDFYLMEARIPTDSSQSWRKRKKKKTLLIDNIHMRRDSIKILLSHFHYYLMHALPATVMNNDWNPSFVACDNKKIYRKEIVIYNRFRFPYNKGRDCRRRSFQNWDSRHSKVVNLLASKKWVLNSKNKLKTFSMYYTIKCN